MDDKQVLSVKVSGVAEAAEAVVSCKLTSEGEYYLKRGSPEAQVWRVLPPAPEKLSLAALKQRIGPPPDNLKDLDIPAIGLCQAIKREWIVIFKPNGDVARKNNEPIDDTVQTALQTVQHSNHIPLIPSTTTIILLKSRKLIQISQ